MALLPASTHHQPPPPPPPPSLNGRLNEREVIRESESALEGESGRGREPERALHLNAND